MSETIAETVAETVAETIAETVPAVTEAVPAVTEAIAETVTMVAINADQYGLMIEYLNWITGFCLFFVVVALCYFGYKFFRIFF